MNNHQPIDHNFELPKYRTFDDPITKWFILTFRKKDKTQKLKALVKYQPSLLEQTYEIYDRPDHILANPDDCKSMFTNATKLYLKPLSLAIYMRNTNVVKLLLDSRKCSPFECNYASNIHSVASANNSADLIQLFPLTIAIRRQCLEMLPNLFNSNFYSDTYSARTPFEIHYANGKGIRKTFAYKDAFQYSYELALTNPYINIVKILDIFIGKCSFYKSGSLDEQKNQLKANYSFLRRLIYLNSTSNCMCCPLIQCMHLIIIKASHFRAQFAPLRDHSGNLDQDEKPIHLNLENVQKKWSQYNCWIHDCFICLTLLFNLYANLISLSPCQYTTKQAGILLLHALNQTGCLLSIMTMPIYRIANNLDFIMNKEISQDVWGINQNSQRLPMPSDKVYHFRKINFSTSMELLLLIVKQLKMNITNLYKYKRHLISLSYPNQKIFQLKLDKFFQKCNTTKNQPRDRNYYTPPDNFQIANNNLTNSQTIHEIEKSQSLLPVRCRQTWTMDECECTKQAEQTNESPPLNPRSVISNGKYSITKLEQSLPIIRTNEYNRSDTEPNKICQQTENICASKLTDSTGHNNLGEIDRVLTLSTSYTNDKVVNTDQRMGVDKLIDESDIDEKNNCAVSSNHCAFDDRMQEEQRIIGIILGDNYVQDKEYMDDQTTTNETSTNNLTIQSYDKQSLNSSKRIPLKSKISELYACWKNIFPSLKRITKTNHCELCKNS